jgi:hypothetical protein
MVTLIETAMPDLAKQESAAHGPYLSRVPGPGHPRGQS